MCGWPMPTGSSPKAKPSTRAMAAAVNTDNSTPFLR